MKSSRNWNVAQLNDLELAFHMAPVGLLISHDRIIRTYNSFFADMFGYDGDALIGESLECLYPSRHEFEHIGVRATAIMRETGCYSDERILRHHDGTLFWCHVSGRSFDKAVPLAGATWAFEDISMRRPVTVELTGRERQISQLLVLGKSSKVIARDLAISPRTVEAHRGRLMKKLKVQTASELIAHLIGRGD